MNIVTPIVVPVSSGNISNTYSATEEELKEGKRRCWSNCNKTAHFEDWTGWRYCFKHWIMDYKYGRGHGLWKALNDTHLVNIFKIK